MPVDYAGPYVFPTVDVAIYRDVDGRPVELQHNEAKAIGREWLLVRKPAEKLWRLCGGFVDVADESFEMAARREVHEELGCEVGRLRYVGSFRVDDPRYREKLDKIVTALFVAAYVDGPIRPADDVGEAQWFSTVDLNQIVVEHRPLLVRVATMRSIE